MVGALKGHSAPVLDMDFSANGKFLASCAEDCGLLAPKEDLDCVDSASPSPSAAKSSRTTRSGSGSKSKSQSSSSAATPPSPSPSSTSSSSEQQRAILSRRQRKNRTRAPRRELRESIEDHEDEHNGPPPAPAAPRHRQDGAKSASKEASNEGKAKAAKELKKSASSDAASKNSSSSSGGGGDSKKCKSQASITKPAQLQQLSDAALASLLRRYALSGDQMAQLGYPVEFSNFPGYAIIINYQQHPLSLRAHHRHQHHRHQHQHHLDANAREFVPSSWNATDADSGNGSASSSSLESSDLEQESASDSDKGSDIGDAGGQQTSHAGSQQRLQNAVERRCARCYKPFLLGREDGEYLHEDKCHYHWGKLRVDGSSPNGGESYECCRARETARGCTTAKAHVWTGIVPGYNGPFHDYVRTRPARQVPRDGNYGAYALDCEMCFTKRGLELGKVSVVALDGKLVYEALVKPDHEVIDYNTRFSGLRAKELAKATKTLRDVQKDITSFVFAETILIGHGLENDLRAMRILHPTCIDTCMAYPHYLGLPFKSSLKTLARTMLRKEIQVKEHDSAEDARIAVDLMLKRLQIDFF